MVSPPSRSWTGSARACPERFVEFDRERHGDALNLDLYGYGPVQNVALVQVRHAFRRARNHRMSTRKDYVLCGFNEVTSAPFRHPVSFQVVRASIRRDGLDPAAPIRAAQRWMWKVTEEQLAASVRQGDILLVSESRRPVGSRVPDDVHVVGGSHEIRSQHIVVGRAGRVFAWAPIVSHIKGQHATVAAAERWYSVRVAREEETWSWSERLGD